MKSFLFRKEIEEREQLGLQEFKQVYKEREIILLLFIKDKTEKRENIVLEPLWKWLVD